LIFSFVHKQDDLWKYIAIIAGGSFISQSMVWVVLRRYASFVRPKWSEMKVHFRPLVVLFIPVVAISLYRVLDKILLWNFSSEAQVGFFEYAERVISLPLGLITAFGTVMLPRMSNISARGDTGQVKEYISKSMYFVMFLAYALSFGLAAVSKDFAPLFFGMAYQPSGVLIACLAATIPFLAFANVIRTQYLIPQCKDNVFIASVALGALVNICANLLLIPRLQAFGASIGTLLAEITVCAVQAFAVRKELPVLGYVKNSLFFLLSGAIMYGAVYFVDSRMPMSVGGLLLQIVCGAAVYLTLSFIYMYVTKNEVLLAALKKIAKK
jgi:O-antigen/teichoic acid export membrane protein